MSDGNGQRYRSIKSTLIVTKPSGEVVEREIELYFDTALGTYGVRFIGESPLKGYCFDLLEREMHRVKNYGEFVAQLRECL